MKKLITIIITAIIFIFASGFKYSQMEEDVFDIDSFNDYQKKFKTEEVDTCALGKTKSYMDYRATTDPTSDQYWFIRNNMEVDDKTGFLIDSDGFIGVALGSHYGRIGDRYYFTLDSGVVLPVVKIEEKADKDTDDNGCYHLSDGSVMEFVIDSGIANNYFGRYGNGLVLQGNYANYKLFSGEFVKVEKVLDELRDDYVSYEDDIEVEVNHSLFNYASGY